MIRFKPWISENYRFNKSRFGRVLLLGESHYGDSTNVNKNFTIEVVQDIIDGVVCQSYRYFTILGRLFNQNDRTDIFNNCAFANLIQEVLEAPRQYPTDSELATIHSAFWDILKLTRPEKVIVTSQRAWEYWLPDNDPRGEKIDDLSVENKHSTIWKYQFDDVDCTAIGIGHPSSRGFYDWRELVKKYLN
jgi:hypothetical protein